MTHENNTAPYLIALDNPLAQHLETSGGKGASLAKAIHHLPVPPGVVITSSAYRLFMRPLQAKVSHLLAQHTGDNDARSAAIKTLILKEPLPANLLLELEATLKAKQLENVPLAVRSSGTLEDLPGAAFAGQHDTFLNVRGVAAVAKAVRACYASLWNAWVLPYRDRLRVDHLTASMAVVVQQLVDVPMTESAGVAFSIDPVRGQLDSVLINAAFGLGESVVGGEAPVDEYHVSRIQANGHYPISESTIASKEYAIVVGEEGTQTRPLPTRQQTQPTLDEKQCHDVAALALAAEKYFGFPQDIEWAYRKGELFLLQSRPVTRISARWTRDESAERFPNAVTPMTWDLVEEGFHTSLNYSFSLMGLPSFNDKWFSVRDSYIYGNQNAVELYSGRLPTHALRDLPTLLAALPEIGKRYAWVQELPIRWMRDLDIYLLGIGALMNEPLHDKTVAQCWDFILRVRDLGRNYFLPNIAISLTQRSLYMLLKHLITMLTQQTTDDPQAIFDRLLAATDTKTGQVNAELWELSRQWRSLPNAPAHIDWAEIDTMPALAQNIRVFLARHGHREIDFDAYQPTWIEAPQVVLDQIAILATLPDENRREHERGLKISMAQTEHELLNQTPPELRFFLQEVIRLARVYTALDDLEHYQTTRLTLPFRRGLAELGARLVKNGVIADQDDIYFCPVSVFETAVNTGGFAAVSAAVKAHKQAYQLAKQKTPDWIYGETNLVDYNATTLKGLGGSPGVIEGEVFIVYGPEDFSRFPEKAILVARTTNPAWTSLFYRASGVVTESGGPLSHGAVTARELNLPAVMSVRNVLECLTNGQRVRIDGSRGVVQVVQ